jgi:hypothetical protein
MPKSIETATERCRKRGKSIHFIHGFISCIHSFIRDDDAPEGDERARRVSSKHSSRSIRFGAVNEVVVRNQTKPINHQSVDATRPAVSSAAGARSRLRRRILFHLIAQFIPLVRILLMYKIH